MNHVIVGASAAGMNAVMALRALDKDANITLISTDEQVYSRCILHHYIEGKRDVPALSFIEKDYIEQNNIRWLKGASVACVDTTAKTLALSTGETVAYDKLLLATGANTHYPPIANLSTAGNVLGLRNLDDAKALKAKAQTASHIVVLGAGLVGIDAVAGLLHTGKPVTLVEMQANLIPLRLDETAAKAYQDAFTAKGVKQYYHVSATEAVLDGAGNIAKLILSNGVELPCDLLVVTTGIRANVGFLEGSGIETDRLGLVFNAQGETNVADVYGAGDVSGRGLIWPAAVKEGIVAAHNMHGTPKDLTDFFDSKSTMNFLGIASLSVGEPNAPDDTYTVEIKQDSTGYKKIIHKDGVITGAIIQGDLSYAGVLTQLVKAKINIAQVKKPIFDIDYSDFFNQTADLQFDY